LNKKAVGGEKKMKRERAGKATAVKQLKTHLHCQLARHKTAAIYVHYN